MDKPIANPKAMKASQVLGRFAECQRRLEEAGLSFEALQWPIDDADFRARLVEFWMSGGQKMAKASTSKFPIWKTIKLGTGHQTADDFRKAIKKVGCKISDWGNDILGKSEFTASTEEVEVHLVSVSVAELGFPNGATREQIYNRAKEIGLELCPPEVGPQLRLQYKDQPMEEWLLIGMDPIADSDGGLRVFGVGRDGLGRWLSSGCGDPDDFWNCDFRWVFVRRK